MSLFISGGLGQVHGDGWVSWWSRKGNSGVAGGLGGNKWNKELGSDRPSLLCFPNSPVPDFSMPQPC